MERVRSAEQLADFVTALSAAQTQDAAARALAEMAARALRADVAAVVSDGGVIAMAGRPDGSVPVTGLTAVKPGAAGSSLEVPGIGACAAAAVALDHPPDAALVVARRRSGLTAGENDLLRGMARAASLRMRMLSVLGQERARHGELERLAREQAALRHVATLVAQGGSAAEIFSAVARETRRVLEADITILARLEPDSVLTVMAVDGGLPPPDSTGTGRTAVPSGALEGVLRTGPAARIDSYEDVPGALAARLHTLGYGGSAVAPVFLEGRLWGVWSAGWAAGRSVPPGAKNRLLQFSELTAAALANTEVREELRGTAEEQSALRRVATLVARGSPQNAVLGAVAREAGQILPGADLVLVGRYEFGQAVHVVGGWSRAGGPDLAGSRVSLGGQNVVTLVFERNEPARADHLFDDVTPTTASARYWARSSIGVPISVEGRLWGVMAVGSRRPDGPSSGIEHRLAAFTELVATAIANTQARDELSTIAAEQAALRRVATLVAGDQPAAVFTAVAKEVGMLFAAEAAAVIRYDPDGAVTAVGAYMRDRSPAGAPRAELGGHNVTTLVFETSRPARVDSYAANDVSGATASARGSGMRSAVGAPIIVEGRLWGALEMASSLHAGWPPGAEERLAEFAELAATALAKAQARQDLSARTAEQAALHRVAALVAQAPPPPAVFAAVAKEVGTLLSATVTVLGRYEPDETMTVVATWRADSAAAAGLPARFDAGLGLSARLRQTGRPARTDQYTGPEAASAATLGIRSAVAAPITVGGRLWGMMTVATTGRQPLPPETESRLVRFTDLVATAIANAEAQAQLTASRARLVTTADETRRRIERDLHDGAQQRLVALALQLRAVQAIVPGELTGLTAELDQLVAGLTSTLDELREYARGIHPAVLTERGLRPALKALARRSAVPVRLRVETHARLPLPVEVTAYLVVSEALANTARHANASAVEIDVAAAGEVLRISVRDDGVGGADPAHASGLVGLHDRVEALGGRIVLDSPDGAGTSLRVELPLAGPAVGE